MITELGDAFWDQLLTRIEIQKVIPVVGPGAITFGPADDLLHPWLAEQVAAKCHLQFPGNDLPKTLQQVVDERRRGGSTMRKSATVSAYSIATSSIFLLAPAYTLCEPVDVCGTGWGNKETSMGILAVASLLCPTSSSTRSTSAGIMNETTTSHASLAPNLL